MQEKRKLAAVFVLLSIGLLTVPPIKAPRYESPIVVQANARQSERFEVTFDSVNGSYITSQNVIYKGRVKTPQAPTRTGYTFNGWKTESGVSWNFLHDQVVDHITLYADWTIINYPITYRLNGGTNSPDNPYQYNINSKVILLEPVKDGYTFIGWEEEGNIPQGTTGPLTFTALWKANG
ncbi:MAG: InlB B-repeat-containing protein [Erysipelotrichales bacterium]|nr:InlB B-repeat-containing protein [Erysipelotrichales bacterium]